MAIKGYWKLNGNSNDYSGNGNNGTDTGITYSQNNGRIGQGAGFNGGSSKIIFPYNSSLNQTGNHTINVWCYFPYQANRTSSVILQKGSDYLAGTNAGRGIQISYTTNSSGYVKVATNSAVTNGSSTVDYSAEDSSYSIPPDTWCMITSVYDYANAKIKLYINSILKKETIITNSSYILRTSPSGGYGGVIGAYVSNSGTLGYFGYLKIDEIIIYNTALTNAPIKNEYSTIKGFF